MIISIKDIVKELFEQVPYSVPAEQAKRKIQSALKAEYETLLLDEMSHLQAIGILISKYGTIQEAGKLAGLTEEEIGSWEKAERIENKKSLIKGFHKACIYSSGSALFSILAVVDFVNCIVFRKWHYPVPGVIFLALAIVSIIKNYRLGKRTSSHAAFLDEDAHSYLQELSDRYRKRFLNSSYIGWIGIAYLVYFIVILVPFAELNQSEAVVHWGSFFIYIEFTAFLCIKNAMRLKWINHLLPVSGRTVYKQKFLVVTISSFLYWTAVIVTAFILRKGVVISFQLFWIAAAVYLIAVTVFNFTGRSRIVLDNIVVNRKRIIAFVMIIVIVISVQMMKMGSFIIQPYISSVSKVDCEKDDIKYNDETGTYTITTDKESFQILQLTDIHLGGSTLSASKDLKALEAVYRLIETTRPDLVIVTGDLVFPLGLFSFSFNNHTPIMQFASFMRNIDIPWAFAYGNHDTETMATSTADEISELFQSVSYKSTDTLLYPYVQPDIFGRNNQLIEVRNTDGSMRQALFLLDSNSYVNDKMNDYDFIHDDQVQWYQNQVESLSKQEGRTIASMLFFHMPLQEYRTAYELYEAGSSQITYFFGENNETMINKVCSSEYPSKLFDTAKELGSTKAMFCGHDHYNNLSVEHEGIRLTYGMSIDCLAMPGIEDDTEQRGGTLITINEDKTFDIQQIKLTDIQ